MSFTGQTWTMTGPGISPDSDRVSTGSNNKVRMDRRLIETNNFIVINKVFLNITNRLIVNIFEILTRNHKLMTVDAINNFPVHLQQI